MVDYTLTPNKSLIKPNRGTYVDSWDTPINSDWDYVDRALGGTYTVPTTTGTITLTNDQARYQQIKLPNTTEVRTIEFPLIEGSSTVAVGGFWIIDNFSSTQDIYVTTLAPGTNTITVKAGKRQIVFSNGSGIFFANDSQITAGTGLTLVGNALSLTSPVTTALGGTGFSNGFSSGQLLIGKADGTLARATLTAGTNISITNGDGSITITSTGGGTGGGGLSSISFSSTTGLTFTPSTLSSTSTSTVLGGTLGVGNGGTGTTGFGVGGFVKSPGTTAALTTVASINLNSSDVGTSVLPILNGGTGVTVFGTGVQAALQLNTSGSGGGFARTVAPAFTGTATFETISASVGFSGISTFDRISAIATTGNTITAKAAANTNSNFVGQNISGTDTFTVNGNGLVTGSGGFKTGSITIDSNGSAGALYFRQGPTTQFYGDSTSLTAVVAGVNLWAGSTTTFTVQSGITPQAYGTTTFTNISDQRVKKNVQPYNLGVAALKQLNTITYQFNGEYGTADDGKTIVGLVAQDVASTPFSTMINDWKYTDPVTGQVTDLMSLNTSELVFALINAVKELDARVKSLEAQIAP